MGCCGMWMVMGGMLAVGATPAQIVPAASAKPAASRELGELQGTWRAVKFYAGDRAIDPSGSSKKGAWVSLELRGDHYEFKGMGVDFKGQVRIDATARPKRIEFVRADGLKTVSTYDLENGTLKLTGVSEKQKADGSDKGSEDWLFTRDKPERPRVRP